MSVLGGMVKLYGGNGDDYSSTLAAVGFVGIDSFIPIDPKSDREAPS